MTMQKHSAATIATQNINGNTAVSTLKYSYPLKFHSVSNPSKQTPTPEAQHTTAWLYEMNFGGGLVSGDHIDIDVNVGENTTAVITGQSSMKIYRAKEKNNQSQHHVNATVEKNGLLCLAFPAVTCYAGAEYLQSQTVKLEDESASVVMVEWMTSGRIAMGESWDFASFQTDNEIWLGSELLIRDAVRLSNDDAPPTVKDRMKPYTSMATIAIVGSRLLPYATQALDEVNKMQIRIGKHLPQGFPPQICTASALKGGKGGKDAVVGTVIKVAAETSSQVLEFVHSILGGVWEDVLGDDPYK